MKKVNYVKSKTLDSIPADYVMVIGARNNGKSYAVKSLVLNKAYKEGTEFIYLRRYTLDIKDSTCELYFADCPVSEITNGEYSTVVVYRKQIFFANVDENGKAVKGPRIGYCMALSASEHLKSLAFPEVGYIIFEEFIATDAQYLYQEAEFKLQQLVSTIFRSRRGKVFLIGNTLSRIVPYYREWGLQEVVRKQKQGEIKYIKKGDATIAVYLTDALNINSGMFFGNAAKTINDGMYEVKECAHLPKQYFKYNVLYTFVLWYNEHKFLCQLLQDSAKANEVVWYVQPKTTELQKRTRVITNQFSTDPYYATSFKDLTENERQVVRMLLDGHVCYSDNLTGTEFENISKYFK